MIPFEEEYYRTLRYEPDPVAGFRLRPHQRLPHVTINADGFRGRSFTGRERILLLGDSATFGVGATSDEARFSCFLELAAGIPTADASIRAYRVFQHFSRLPWLLAKVPQVRCVFLWCGYVDLFYWVHSGGRIDGAFTLEQIHGASRFLKDLRRRFSRLFAPLARGVVVPLYPMGVLLDSMMRYIQAFRDLLESRGIMFVILIQPFLRQEPQAPHLKTPMDQMNERVRRRWGEDWYSLSRAYCAQLRGHLERQGNIRWLDCQSLTTEADFLDGVHLKESAMERMAYTLAQTLELVSKEAVVLTGKGGAP